MKRWIALFAMFCFCGNAVTAQTDAPEWYKQKSASLLPNVTLATGAGHTEREAFAIALAEGIGASASLEVASQSFSDIKNGLETVLPAINKKVKRMYVEETPSGMYYVLIAVQNNVTLSPDFDRQIFDSRYNSFPSAFIPGMAQIHKGSRTKGLMFIAGEITLAGGVVVCEGLRASYESKITSTHSESKKQSYRNNADDMLNLRNGFIFGLAAVYVWNVIDGLAAKGNLHIRLTDDSKLRLLPYFSPYTGSGLMLSLNF